MRLLKYRNWKNLVCDNDTIPLYPEKNKKKN